MKFAFVASVEEREGDLLILPFWEGPKAAAECAYELSAVLRDFEGKGGETALCYQGKERLLLLGLGKQEKATVEALRRAYAAAAKVAQAKKVRKIDVLFPKCKQKEEFLRGIAEGLLLTNYLFSYKQEKGSLIEKTTWIGVEGRGFVDRLKRVAEGVYFVRDWVNENADAKTPRDLVEMVRKFPSEVKVKVFDKKWLEKEKMGLILAVSRGSAHEPYLVQASYHGNAKSKEHIVLVGKGVTYDTGGLCLKTPDGIVVQKADMAGAATALGVVRTAAELGLKVNVTAVAPLAENCIDGKSYKPGDVYRSYAGKTVEVTNTDAEGRLVLADAIAYAVKHLKPSCLIDLATLTGACIVGLGEDFSGLFSNDDDLAEDLLASSEATDELIWRMPVHADYLEEYKSEIADIVNSAGRNGGAIKAALFLQEFVGEVSWAHLDIAGPAFISKPKHYFPMKGTGHGLRLLIDFLERRSQ